MSEPASSDGEDISASSEDWDPNESDNDSDDEIFENTRKSRKKLLKSSDILPKSDIIQNNAKPRAKVSNDSDSESSVEDYLVHPDSINFKSAFFGIANESKNPSFDEIEQSILGGVDNVGGFISAGSDNEDDNNENSAELCEASASKIAENDNDKKLNFKQIHDFAKNLETVKTSMQNYCLEKRSSEINMNIDQLLALGEKSGCGEDMNVADSESEDFEEIQTSRRHESKIPKDGITITINAPDTNKSSKTREDYRMKIRRRMNMIKKQNQIYIHKVHVLCWIAHGNCINRILNYPKLLKAVLGLIPSNNCYPPKQSDLKYLEMIVKWYIGKMKFSDFSKKKDKKIEKVSSIAKLNLHDNLTLVQSLSIQIKAATASSHRNLILIFVILMRALGLQCRLVLSFVTLPLKPPPEELYSLTKKPDNKTSNDKAASSKSEVEIKKTESKKKFTSDTASTPKLESKSETSNDKSKEHASAKVRGKTSKKETNDKKRAETSNTRSSLKHENEDRSFKSPTSERKKCYRLKPKTDRSSSTSKQKPEESFKSPERTGISDKSKSKIKAKKNVSPFSPAVTRKKAKVRLEALKNSAELKISQLDGTDDSPRNKKLNLKNIKSIATKKQKKSLEPKIDTKNEQSPEKKSSENKKRTVLKEHSKHSDKNIPQAGTSGNNCATKRKKSKELTRESEYFKPITKKIKKFDIDRRVLSTDDDEDSGKRKGCDIWAEVYLESEEKWISVDVANCKIHCIKELYNKATHPVTYIVVWNNDLSLKDVTRRYVPKWNTVTRKLRAEPSWWEVSLKPWLGNKTLRDRQEDEDLYRSQLEQPLPTSIQEFKNHPLYVLKRHILKFEAIYPPDAITLGFIRREPVFARECVHTLHSREMWLKEAKTVRIGEKPYKIVKARPKYDKLTGSKINDLPLELFGSWQIEDYDPPTAENGIVPRNAYGNVELFKPSMIPKGTVHLQLPGLNKVARKLQIDCAPAVIGFDFHSGFTHPLFDGYVVCQEHQDILVAAWYQEEEEAEKRANDRTEKRVYGNWRRLIKGLIIRERLKARYNFDSPEESKNEKIYKGPSKSNAKRKKKC